MIILRIKDSGHTIDLPGMNGIKTPTEIDISKMNISVVISTLRKNGISKYEILSKDKKIESKQNINIQKNEECSPENMGRKIYSIDDISLKNKVENIELLLLKLINDSDSKAKRENIEKNVVKIFCDENEEGVDFIPSIDISGMMSKGDITKTTTKNTDNNISESVNLLKSVSKKKTRKDV